MIKKKKSSGVDNKAVSSVDVTSMKLLTLLTSLDFLTYSMWLNSLTDIKKKLYLTLSLKLKKLH